MIDIPQPVAGWFPCPKAAARSLPERGLDPTDLAVLACILSYADDGGEAWPAQETVAEELGVSPRTVKRSVVRLRASGLLEVRRRGHAPQVYRCPRLLKGATGGTFASAAVTPAAPLPSRSDTGVHSEVTPEHPDQESEDRESDPEYPPTPQKAIRPKKAPQEPAPWALELACLLAANLEEIIPSYVPPTEARRRQWAIDIEKLDRLDHVPQDRIAEVLQFAMRDPFWQTNIQSGGKFREKFNQLGAKEARNPNASPSRHQTLGDPRPDALESGGREGSGKYGRAAALRTAQGAYRVGSQRAHPNEPQRAYRPGEDPFAEDPGQTPGAG